MNSKILASISSVFTLAVSILNSSAAVVSVDIEQYNYTTGTNLSNYYLFRETDQIIVSTPWIPSPNNGGTVFELTNLDFVAKFGTSTAVPGIRGANVDLMVDPNNANLIDIFLRPIAVGSNTHKLGVTIDFNLDPGQVIQSFGFVSGNMWSPFSTPAERAPDIVRINPNRKSVYIEYQFTITASNPQGVNTFQALTTFEKFTMTIGNNGPVPEPSSITLIGISCMLLLRRNRKNPV